MAVRRLACAAAIFTIATAVAAGDADNTARAARDALRDCLNALPADQLADERAIAACLDRAQKAGGAERNRDKQIEFMRQLDDLDRMIERTTRGSRR